MSYVPVGEALSPRSLPVQMGVLIQDALRALGPDQTRYVRFWTMFVGGGKALGPSEILVPPTMRETVAARVRALYPQSVAMTMATRAPPPPPPRPLPPAFSFSREQSPPMPMARQAPAREQPLMAVRAAKASAGPAPVRTMVVSSRAPAQTTSAGPFPEAPMAVTPVIPAVVATTADTKVVATPATASSPATVEVTSDEVSTGAMKAAETAAETAAADKSSGLLIPGLVAAALVGYFAWVR